MIKTVITIGSAAILAGIITIMPAPGVEAGTRAVETRAASAQDAAAWRREAALALAGGACAQRAWPYYDQGCLRQGEPRKVRLVTPDRLN